MIELIVMILVKWILSTAIVVGAVGSVLLTYLLILAIKQERRASWKL